MTNYNLKFLQLNCRRMRNVNSKVELDFSKGLFDVLILQEPSAWNSKINFDKSLGKIFYDQKNPRPRTAIIVNNNLKEKAYKITQFSNNDCTTIMLNIGKKSYVITSLYLHNNLSEFTVKLCITRIVDFAKKHNYKLIIASDLNGHHPIWGSEKIDTRGENIFDIICDSNLKVENNGDPTFHRLDGSGYESAIDVTLSNFTNNEIINWQSNVYDYGSDHYSITFFIKSDKIEKIRKRIVKNTNWDSFKNQIKLKYNENRPVSSINNIEELNYRTDILNDTLIDAFEKSCPLSHFKNKFKKPWYNDELLAMKKDLNVRRHKIIAMKNSNTSTQNSIFLMESNYKKDMEIYNKKIEIARDKSFEQFASEIEKESECARLTNIFKRISIETNATLRSNNDSFASNSTQTLDALVNEHFPQKDTNININQILNQPSTEEKIFIKKLTTKKNIREAINSFKAFKTPGIDSIYPCMLQNAIDYIIDELKEIFTFCLNFGVTPDRWLVIKVIFIPKPGKVNYQNAKDFRPISLMSFLLKTLEKLVAEHIVTMLHKLHPKQYAYMKGRDATQALNDFTHIINKRLHDKQVTFTSFNDISGAFDKPDFELVKKSLEKFGLEKILTNWIYNMNKNRVMHATHLDKTKKFKSKCGFPQGGVLSCLLWLIYVDDLVRKLNELPRIDALFFADDIVIVSLGSNQLYSSMHLQKALNLLEKWCRDNFLNINPQKSVHIKFTKKTKLRDYNIKFYDQNIQFAKETKYLGIILDSKLEFRQHFENLRCKIVQYSHRLAHFIKSRWGMNPRMASWAYNSIVIPKIKYAASCWIHKIDERKNAEILKKAQNAALRAATCAMFSTPSLGMQAALGVLPIRNEISMQATMELLRLCNNNQWHNDDSDPIRKMIDDKFHITERSTSYDVISVSRDEAIECFCASEQDWREGLVEVTEDLKIYTDASVDRNRNRSGIGIISNDANIKYAGFYNITMSSYKAEAIAVTKALSMILNQNIQGRRIAILTDSMSVIKVLSNDKTRSKMIRGIKRLIRLLINKNNAIKFYWFPAHTSMDNEYATGNNEADALTRAENAETCLLLQNAPLFKNEMKKEIIHQHRIEAAQWPDDTHKVSKKFKLNLLQKENKNLTKFSRMDFSLLLRFTTGFNCLARHIHKVKKNENIPTFCRFCKKSDEIDDSVHIIEDCEYFTIDRIRIFGTHTLKLDYLDAIDYDKILQFIKKRKELSYRLLKWYNSLEEVRDEIDRIEENNCRNAQGQRLRMLAGVQHQLTSSGQRHQARRRGGPQ